MAREYAYYELQNSPRDRDRWAPAYKARHRTLEEARAEAGRCIGAGHIRTVPLKWRILRIAATLIETYPKGETNE